MREILFRGKRMDNGEWIEGDLLHPDIYGNGYSIEDFTKGKNNCFDVDPETIGQWTGLVDKNGVKIFEGDIFEIEEGTTGNVIFKDGCFRIEEYGIYGTWTESGFDECGGGYGIIQCDPIEWYTTFDMEVIGNIHDKKAVEE